MWDYADGSKETKANGGPAEFADKLYQTGFQDGTIEGFSSGQRSMLGAIGIIGGACFICGGLVVSRLKIWLTVTRKRNIHPTRLSMQSDNLFRP